MRRQPVGFRFDPQMAPEDLRAIKQLPLKLRTRFQRRAMRQALMVFKKLAHPLYKRHRSTKSHPHLDEALFVKTRTYRDKRRGQTVYGIVGFRAGPLGGNYVRGRRLVQFSGPPQTQWAGWRAHFLEHGFVATGGIRARLGDRSTRSAIRTRVKRGEGKRIPGKRYLTSVYQVGRMAATQAFQLAVRQLIQTSGKSSGRLTRSLYAAEMRALLA
jgi:hypothetical protein